MRILLLLYYLPLVYSKISTSLTSGSFDEQTYGRNGVVLLWKDSRRDVYDSFTAAAGDVKDEDIHFWDLSCSLAPDFCDLNARGNKVPLILYSFRNEPWKALTVQLYDKHAFTTFFNSQLKANCFANRTLCTDVMNNTITDHIDLDFDRVKRSYLDVQQEVAQVEHDWDKVSERIQSEFFSERKKVQDAVDVLDQKLKVLGQMLEHIHNENYKDRERPLEL